MRFRRLGQTGLDVSALGFGCMRLPVLCDADGRPDHQRIDEATATAMLRRAIAAGVNYVDTAWMYHGEHSESWLGRALQGGYREQVVLADKSPTWRIAAASDFDRFLNLQLERLQTDHIDLYLLHGLDDANWHKVADYDLLSAAERALGDGRIGHLGFSFHGSRELFSEVLAATDLWSFCQIQLNYMDEEYQAGRAGLEEAAARGLGVVIMEPLRGGSLAGEPPLAVAELLETEVGRRRTAIEWAFDWLWTMPEVGCVLSGMGTPAQLEENITYAARSEVGMLAPAELDFVTQLRAAYESLDAVPCTACRYCLPCPNGVAIPEMLARLNDTRRYDDLERQRLSYSWVNQAERAVNCTACGACEEICPQHIGISSCMRDVEAVLGQR